MAVGYVPMFGEEAGEELDRWLGAIGGAGNGLASRVALSVSLRATLDAITFVAVGKEPIADWVRERLADWEVVREEAVKFQALRDSIEPARLGHWMEIMPESADSGWRFEHSVALARARTSAAATAASERLATWAERHGLATCDRVGRSVGVGNAYADLRIPFGARSPSEGVALALDGLTALGLPLPPPDCRAEMERSAGPTALRVWLTERGIARGGIVMPALDTERLVRLAGVFGASENLQAIAAFSGALGVDHPTWVEHGVLATGPFLELHFENLAD